MSLQQQLEQQLRDALQPRYLQLVNESHRHHVPSGSESHFKLVLVCDEFSGKRLIQRHQRVYQALGDSMQRFHALALHTYSPDEWANQAPDSPNCRGGSLSQSGSSD